MKVLITGINGFVGKILHKVLLDKGYDVYGIDIHSEDDKILSADITDYNSLERNILNISPDFIVHLAAVSRTDNENPELLYRINVNGTLNILRAAVKMKIKPKFLLVSSSYVYGNIEESKQPITEDDEIYPVNHYGASKAASENIGRAFKNEYGLPLVIARPFNHIGVGQDKHFIVPKIIRTIKDKRNTIELGNVKTVRDFLDVRDVVSAYLRIIDNFMDNEVFNIASGNGVMISEIINLIEKISGNKLKIRTEGSLLRSSEIFHLLGDYTKIKEKLSWHPVFNLKETLEWIWQNGN